MTNLNIFHTFRKKARHTWPSTDDSLKPVDPQMGEGQFPKEKKCK